MIAVKIAAFTNPVGFCLVAMGTGAGSCGGNVCVCESWGKKEAVVELLVVGGNNRRWSPPEVLLETLPS